ncbi:MAG: PQQ-binding-like beta-propeller repeat protein [Planctomycetaceae bacterium]|nr:PQQ-binding-like beta-propeller repeat protein [Planctomycetaceae bacterium]
MSFRIFSLLFLLCLLSTKWLPVKLSAEDWPQFRGTNSSGIAAGNSAPIHFGPDMNVLWNLSLDAGHSSPCIVGDALFLTTYHKSSNSLFVLCIDRRRGTVRWQRRVDAKSIERGHPSFNPASSTPTSDGKRVVAYFGSYGLICFDMLGTKLWDVQMPLTKSYPGNATSPAIFGDLVILYRGNYVDHFLLAVNKTTGKEVWRIKQDEHITGEMACTACPIVMDGKLIVHTARAVRAFQLNTGKHLWTVKCATTATSTPVLAGEEIIVAAWNKLGEEALRPPFPDFDELVKQNDKNDDQQIGRDEFPTFWIFHRPEGAEAPQNGATVRFQQVDSNRDGQIVSAEGKKQIAGIERYRAQASQHGMLAIKLNQAGQNDPTNVRILDTASIPEVPSPLSIDGYLYFVKNGGILTCLEIATGKRIYRMRTPGRGTHYASPFISGGKLYTISGAGVISVLTLGPNPKLLATNDMLDEVYASPAVVDGTIYVRTHAALYAFRYSDKR